MIIPLRLTPRASSTGCAARCGVGHYALRTEQAYVDWVRRFIRFHGLRHPAELGSSEVTAFLTHLAVERQVSPSTQN